MGGRGASGKAAARGGEDSSTRASASDGGAPSAPGGARAPKGTQASAPAPDPAFHADGVTQMPTLPRSITQTSGSMTLRAFPALVPQGTAAAPAAGVRVALAEGVVVTARVTAAAWSELGLGVGDRLWVSVKATQVRAIRVAVGS